MLRIRLDINGRDIGCVGVHNKEEYDDEGRVRYGVYDLRGHSMHSGEITDYPKITDVWHHRAYCAASLTVAVMDEVDEDRLDRIPR